MKRITFLFSLALALLVSMAAQMPTTEQYRLTAKLIHELGSNLAVRPTDSLQEMWPKFEEALLMTMRLPMVGKVTDEERGERNWLIEHVKSKRDAWDRPVLIYLNSPEHKAMIASVGLDGVEATPDDLICKFDGQIRQDSDKQNRVHYVRAWTLPEEFSRLGYQFLGDEGGTVTTTKKQ